MNLKSTERQDRRGKRRQRCALYCLFIPVRYSLLSFAYISAHIKLLIRNYYGLRSSVPFVYVCTVSRVLVSTRIALCPTICLVLFDFTN
jgi:hypothetical protein